MSEGKRSARDTETVRRLKAMDATWNSATRKWTVPVEHRAALDRLLADLGYSRRAAQYERSGDKRRNDDV